MRLATQDTLDEMRDLVRAGRVDDEVRSIAISASKDPRGPISGITRWVRQSMEYIRDPKNTERLADPRRLALDYLEGSKPLTEDCDGYSVMAAALLQSIGIDCRIIVVNLTPSEDHALILAYSDDLGQWVCSDLTSDFPVGWGSNYVVTAEINP